ncbi:MAG: molecular chaperone TorD family protein [Gammaproteobacteria bacterium]|nr:molecular chaperone TorD family protein [Gammaproteobacteria bacterium]
MNGNNEIDDTTLSAPALAGEYPDSDTSVCEEQRYRASAYGLLAALLRSSPDQAMLGQLCGLCEATSEGDELMLSMSMLALAAKMHSAEDVEEEYHQLFIGLGKGEVVPYGSWYLTGFLMEKPLSDLREDLAKLGFERSEDIAEPEDHAAALCEVISILIGDASDLSVQNEFFQTHMASWLDRFFSDLGSAESAVFYKSVARFGAAIIALEKQYFSMQV